MDDWVLDVCSRTMAYVLQRYTWSEWAEGLMERENLPRPSFGDYQTIYKDSTMAYSTMAYSTMARYRPWPDDHLACYWLPKPLSARLMTLLPSRLAVTVAFQGSLSSLSHHPYVTSAVCSTFTDLEDSRRHRPIGRLHDIWTLYRKIVVALRQPWRRRDALQNGSALRTTLSCYEREKCEFKKRLQSAMHLGHAGIG